MDYFEKPKINKENYRNYVLENQYHIPKSLYGTAKIYGDSLSYNVITKLYSISVDEVLIYFGVPCIIDIQWGRGLQIAKDLWIEKMDKAIELKKTNSMTKEIDDRLLRKE